eukprot:1157777-Pelagomonas_calceolata.AAC.1
MGQRLAAASGAEQPRAVGGLTTAATRGACVRACVRACVSTTHLSNTGMPCMPAPQCSAAVGRRGAAVPAAGPHAHGPQDAREPVHDCSCGALVGHGCV